MVTGHRQSGIKRDAVRTALHLEADHRAAGREQWVQTKPKSLSRSTARRSLRSHLSLPAAGAPGGGRGLCRQTLREAGWAARASLPSPAWERVAAAAGPGGGTGRGGGLWHFLQGIVLMAEPGYGIIGPANVGRGASKLVAESGCLTVSPGLSEERVYIAGHGSLRYFSITVSRLGIFPNSVQRASTVAHPPHLEAQEHGEPRASHLVSSPDPGARSRPAFLCTSWGPHGCPRPAQPGSVLISLPSSVLHSGNGQTKCPLSCRASQVTVFGGRRDRGRSSPRAGCHPEGLSKAPTRRHSGPASARAEGRALTRQLHSLIPRLGGDGDALVC